MDNPELIEIIAGVLTLVIGWAVKELAAWLRAKAATEEQRAVIDHIERHAAAAVEWASQTMVKEVRKTGPLTAESKRYIKRAAFDRALAALDPNVLASAQRAWGDARLNDVVDTAIEGYVRLGKLRERESVSGVAVKLFGGSIPLED